MAAADRILAVKLEGSIKSTPHVSGALLGILLGSTAIL